MYEEPPPLPFPSLNSLKVIATTVLKSQRNPSTPEVEFKYFDPIHTTNQLEKKKQKPSQRACSYCRKKKIKCDINADEKCKKGSCHCSYHITDDTNDKPDESSPPNGNLPDNTALNDTIPSTTVFRHPGLISSGHYTGETSFCGQTSNPDSLKSLIHEDQFPDFTQAPKIPYLSQEDQYYLIDVYYENTNPFYPLMSKQELLIQLDNVNNQKPTYLSPLFFYALFARAAFVELNKKTTSDNRSFKDLGTDCLNYASALVNFYRDKSRVSTILALIIMTNHLEQEKRNADLSRSWLWAGEAFRMALDLGIHRSFISDGNDTFGQLCIRTFWLAYIADCTIGMTYGRPSATEEKVLDVKYPTKLPTDDLTTGQWIDSLNELIHLSKVTARVTKFNYCPPPPFIIKGPVKRHNAFLVSVDSWLVDIMQPKEAESPIANPPNSIEEESTIVRRMNFQKIMYLYTNLILLHRPYVYDTLPVRNASNRPSYDICSYAAIIITDITSKLDDEELLYHARYPIIAYALIMAIRVHILNASSSNPDKYNAVKNFKISLDCLMKLPQAQDESTMLSEAIRNLESQFINRHKVAQEREDTIRIKQQLKQNINKRVITSAQIVFSPDATETKNLFHHQYNLSFANIPNTLTNTPFASSSKIPTTSTSAPNPHSQGMIMKSYRPPPPNNKKRKKPKGPNETNSIFVDSQDRKQKHKEKQKSDQQQLQTTFSSHTTLSALPQTTSLPQTTPLPQTSRAEEYQIENYNTAYHHNQIDSLKIEQSGLPQSNPIICPSNLDQMNVNVFDQNSYNNNNGLDMIGSFNPNSDFITNITPTQNNNPVDQLAFNAFLTNHRNIGIRDYSLGDTQDSISIYNFMSGSMQDILVIKNFDPMYDYEMGNTNDNMNINNGTRIDNA